jgi:hypothetical protein
MIDQSRFLNSPRTLSFSEFYNVKIHFCKIENPTRIPIDVCHHSQVTLFHTSFLKGIFFLHSVATLCSYTKIRSCFQLISSENRKVFSKNNKSTKYGKFQLVSSWVHHSLSNDWRHQAEDVFVEYRAEDEQSKSNSVKFGYFDQSLTNTSVLHWAVTMFYIFIVLSSTTIIFP